MLPWKNAFLPSKATSSSINALASTSWTGFSLCSRSIATSNKTRKTVDIFTSSAHSAKLLATVGSKPVPRKFPESSLPEVRRMYCYRRGRLGANVDYSARSNVGKSSLLNAVIGRTGKDLLFTGKRAGRTQTLNFYEVGAMNNKDTPKLVVVDAPGYGERGRPEWGDLVNDYIENRPNLRRIFLLLNGKHTIHETDLAMLRSLDERMQDPSDVKSGNRICTLQAVVTKLDTFAKASSAADIKAIRSQIFEAAPTCLPPIFTSTTMKPAVGIIALRRAIAEACGLPEPTSGGY